MDIIKIIKEELERLLEDEESKDAYDDDYDGEEEGWDEDVENQWRNNFTNLSPNHQKLIDVFEDINGIYGITPGESEQQFLKDPNVGHIADKGRYFDGSTKIQAPMQCEFEYQHEGCHVNSFRLYGRGMIDSVIMGYAYIPKNRGWSQHFWGLKDGKIVETTPTFMNAKDYFGIILGEKIAIKFGNNVIKQFSPNEIDTWYNK